MNSSLQDNTIILAATVASSAFVVILIITTAAISVLSLMIILIWKRNTNKKSQHPVSTDENVCYTTSNSLIEDSKEYTSGIIILYCVTSDMPAGSMLKLIMKIKQIVT